MQRLLSYAQSNSKLSEALTQAALEEQPVRWRITIASGGRLIGLIDASIDKRSPAERIPKIGSRTGTGSKPLLAVDTADYVLGPPDTAPVGSKGYRNHEAFRGLLREAAATTGDEGLRAAAAFYDDPTNLAKLRAELSTLKPGVADRFAFTLDSDQSGLVCQRTAAIAYWNELSAGRLAARSDKPAGKRSAGGSSGLPRRCLVCGEAKPIADRHLTPIKGVPDAQSSGAALVSFNENAFESHNWSAAENSPTCADCAETYTRALNQLLRRDNQPRTRFDEGGVAFLFWATRNASIDIYSLIFEMPKPEMVRDLLRSPYTGKPSLDGEAAHVCTLALAGAAARVMVRQWLDVTVDEAQRNLARWFEDLSIVAARDQWRDNSIVVHAGELALPPRVGLLLEAMVRDPKKDVPAGLPGDLVRSAITGSPLPAFVLAAAVRRLAVEQGGGTANVLPARIGLIKAALNRLPDATAQGGRQMTTALDRDQEDPGYLCGRLLAVLEYLQYAAIGNVNASVVDRFYGRAAASPVSAFPILMRLARSHLRALRRSKGGLAVTLDREIEGILSGLSSTESFPVALPLAQQGRFALGYYHQKGDRATPVAQIESAAADDEEDNDDEEVEE